MKVNPLYSTHLPFDGNPLLLAGEYVALSSDEHYPAFDQPSMWLQMRLYHYGWPYALMRLYSMN